MTKSEITLSNVNVRESISMLLGKLVFIDFIAAVFIIFLYLLLMTGGNFFNVTYQNTYLFLGFFILIGIGKIIIDIYAVLQWLNEYYEITSENIVIKKGIFFRKIERHRIDHIREIEFTRSIFSEIFNTGSLLFYDEWMHKDLEMSYIHNPKKYINLLCKLNPKIEIKEEKVRKSYHESE